MNIHVVFAADEQYACHMGVAMTSILMNSSVTDEIFFHVLSDTISMETRQKILALREIRGFDLEIQGVDRYIHSAVDRINTIGCNHRLTKEAYYRLMVGRIFPDLEKIIYLDCDIVVLGSLEDLWNTDLSNYTIASVEEVMDPPLHRDTFLGNARYFNSGVLLFNLSRWRSLGYEEKCLQVDGGILKIIAHHDQSILNYVFREGDVYHLGIKYNYLINFQRFFKHAIEPVGLEFDPVIVHYAGHKPWLLDGFLDREQDLDCYSHYWDYRARSPWAEGSPLGQIHTFDVLRYLYRHPKDAPAAIDRLRRLKTGRLFS